MTVAIPTNDAIVVIKFILKLFSLGLIPLEPSLVMKAFTFAVNSKKISYLNMCQHKIVTVYHPQTSVEW